MGVTRIVAASDHSIAPSMRAIELRSSDRDGIGSALAMIFFIA
jgi:hypothetical protein